MVENFNKANILLSKFYIRKWIPKKKCVIRRKLVIFVILELNSNIWIIKLINEIAITHRNR